MRLDPDAPLAFFVDGLLDGPACATLIERYEALGFERAPITTARGFVFDEELRNNTRVMEDSPALAAALWAMLAPHVPPTLHGRWRAIGLNERFRVYRYEPGQRFAPHFDGYFRRHDGEESAYTVMVYLNEGFTGGHTNLLELQRTIVPRVGRAGLFQHHILHEGAEVTAGVKYALRTDVMYRRDPA